MKVLIIKLSSMGDILHTLPALTDAKCALSGVSFDWVVEENFVQIPSWHPAVHKVIPIAIRRWKNYWFNIISWKEYFNFKYILQKNYYDVIIDAQGLLKSAFFVTRIVQGEKHGMDFKSAKEPLSSLFYNYKHTIDKKQHAIKRIRQLFSASLNYVLSTKLGDYSISNHFKPKFEIVPYLMFIHSTTCYKKHWPEYQWRTLISLAIKDNYQIKLPWGEKHEYLRALRLSEGFDKVIILPKMTIEQLAKHIVNSITVISVDTGISHLAAALNCPNFTLYGPTQPDLIGIYGKNQIILHAKDGSMDLISAERVWTAFKNSPFYKK